MKYLTGKNFGNQKRQILKWNERFYDEQYIADAFTDEVFKGNQA